MAEEFTTRVEDLENLPKFYYCEGVIFTFGVYGKVKSFDQYIAAFAHCPSNKHQFNTLNPQERMDALREAYEMYKREKIHYVKK